MDRRDFSKQTLGSLLTIALLESVFAADAVSDEIKPIASQWLARLHSMSSDLKGQKLTQTQWQGKVEELFSRVDLSEFLQFVDFDKLTHNMKFRERGERAFRPRFPEVEGLPTKLVFGHQMFALQRDRAVAPHGHNNMATAFLILKGEFDGKHFDRLEDYDDHMIVKPTIDRKFKPGEYSTVSDHKDNVHWFKALSKTAYIFNIHVLNVDPKIKRGGRVYIDPLGEKLEGGRIKAPKLSGSEAIKRFG